jgi:hypothetical protein
MVMALGLIIVGLIMVVSGVAYHLEWKLKFFRLSSHVKGSRCPPLTFCILEDITGGDGGGGKKYREAAMARYNVSPRFRRLLVELLWAWSLSAIALGVVLIAVIFSIRADVAYGIGWGVPAAYGAIGAWATIAYCKRSVRIEKEQWASARLQQQA